MSNKLTKIVATISDERCDTEFLRSLIQEGVNVVRLNTAHMSPEDMERVIDNVRAVNPYVGILMDTKGPEIRTTKCEEPICFQAGDRVCLKGAPEEFTTRQQISLSYPDIINVLKVGMRILIDDGDLEFQVEEIKEREAVCVAQNEATLKSRKSVNIPDVHIPLPSLTAKDLLFIEHAIRKDIDFIAHSFVRTQQDVLDIQHILDEHNSPIEIIAKIENQEGVDNIDSILSVASGIMVARGDLGIEIPFERIPGIQRHLIRKAIERKKPVIVATQMLHSMIENPRPTRAEVTDIANAIYYRTDAVMLSGETAYGKYPVEAVRTMSKVIYEAEQPRLEANEIRLP
ncbi:pyruvate kinase, partial [Porphyromonas macacae]|uniref:pyruvate kinase n=1 Tax=Porphyromonas macacae TaxID=28115 RepID=UPI0024ADDBB9